MDCYSRSGCHKDEHPRPFSTHTDAVLWADVVLGESEVTELLSQSISRTLMPQLVMRDKER